MSEEFYYPRIEGDAGDRQDSSSEDSEGSLGELQLNCASGAVSLLDPPNTINSIPRSIDSEEGGDAQLLNDHHSLVPRIESDQIIKCLAQSKIPRNRYEPMGGTVPSISANTGADYDFIMDKYPEGKIPMHGGKRIIEVLPFTQQ